ncbi:thioredoxin family protein [Putridiphycobacter roseus]|uniref:Thioredoxin family protein n=1 Tax=Putridiphycobacter roseus TaxID=2219161 RepID=A0A2W1NN92_9FLAO|nr:thioredoxin family protein [Putridiphycobacter roseus]PZE16048.1 thioredoxin family protein [Putridiphycobacter roseus]
MNTLLTESIQKSISYQDYRQLVIDLYAAGKSTTENGPDTLLPYSKLNISRMKRLDKTTKISTAVEAAIKSINKPITWLVITEGWCGDAAQNLPIINALAVLNPNIELKIVLRDANVDLMNAYLTNGGQAIPKLIQIEDGEETATWGPRPTMATKMVNDYKAEHGSLTPEFKEALQVWYNQDKGVNTIEDILTLLKLEVPNVRV